MAEFDALREALDRETPPPAADRRERAILAALDEFDRATQGNDGMTRLTSPDGAGGLRNHGRRSMSTSETSWRDRASRFAIAAALLVAVVSVPVGLRIAGPGSSPQRTAIVAVPETPAAAHDAQPARTARVLVIGPDGIEPPRTTRTPDAAAPPQEPAAAAVEVAAIEAARAEADAARAELVAREARELAALQKAREQAERDAGTERRIAVATAERVAAELRLAADQKAREQAERAKQERLAVARAEREARVAEQNRMTAEHLASQRQALAMNRPSRMAQGPAAPAAVAPLLATPVRAPGLDLPPSREKAGTARYPAVETGGFRRVGDEPVSTVSIDVDTTSYTVVRAHLNRGRLPPATAVRTEELVNYFSYAYPRPRGDAPFEITTTVMPSPWAPERKLLHVAVQGREIPAAERKRANLVLLVDVSGSMNAPNRLPLAQSALALLLDTLRPDDTVSIVTYAGRAGVALEPTRASERARIRDVIDRLEPGGATAGFDGLATAYRLARESFAAGGVNRVLLMTDGDFNVGPSSGDELTRLVTEGRKAGVYLTVLGFGMSNYQDTTMQTLAQNGNGNAAYIDSLSEARKVLVDEANSTVFPIADDVKIQVEFNPAAVSEYRLLGYETRMLRREDFNDDRVDAGEVGSGAVVTAIYEFVPAGGPATADPLRYGRPAAAPVAATPAASEYAFLRLRYKRPGEQASRLIERPVPVASVQDLASAGADQRFAVAVAGFAELLRGGRHQGSFSYDDVYRIAAAVRGDDPFGRRGEFLGLVLLAEGLSRSGRGP